MLSVPHDTSTSANLCNFPRNDRLVCHHGCDMDMAALLHIPLSFSPKSQEMSSDSEMAISDVSTAESAFCGAAEAPRGAGARAAGDGATRAVVREQVARLEAATGWGAQVEAMSRAARKTQLWNILREHMADDPALVQAVSELERLDEVNLPPRSSLGQMQDVAPE